MLRGSERRQATIVTSTMRLPGEGPAVLSLPRELALDRRGVGKGVLATTGCASWSPRVRDSAARGGEVLPTVQARERFRGRCARQSLGKEDAM